MKDINTAVASIVQHIEATRMLGKATFDIITNTGDVWHGFVSGAGYSISHDEILNGEHIERQIVCANLCYLNQTMKKIEAQIITGVRLTK